MLKMEIMSFMEAFARVCDKASLPPYDGG